MDEKKDVIGQRYHIDLFIDFFDEKNASIDIKHRSEERGKHFGELLLFTSFTLRQVHNLGLANPVSVSLAEVLAFCGNPTRPLTLLVGPHELSLGEVITELKKGSIKPPTRFISMENISTVNSFGRKGKKRLLGELVMENQQLRFTIRTKGLPFMGPGALYYVPVTVGFLLQHIAEINSHCKKRVSALQHAAKYTGEILQSGKVTAMNQSTLAYLIASRAFSSSLEAG
ncbi:MAG: hypothetical protein P8Z41_08105 [Anaerolineales bacterium]